MGSSLALTFCSYKGGAGRTTTAVNVAYHLASMGKKVVIVDLDVEGPGLGSILDVKDELLEEKGLHRFLLDEWLSIDSPPSLTQYVIMQKFPKTPDCDGVEFGLVGSPLGAHKRHYPINEVGQVLPRMRRLDEELKRRFDVVIYDAPSGISDFAVMAFSLSSANCICFRWSKQHVRGAIQMLRLQYGFLEDQRSRLRDFFPIANAVARPETEAEFKRTNLVTEVIQQDLLDRQSKSLKLAKSYEVPQIQYVWEFNELKFEDKVIVDSSKSPYDDFKSLSQYICHRLNI